MEEGAGRLCAVRKQWLLDLEFGFWGEWRWIPGWAKHLNEAFALLTTNRRPRKPFTLLPMVFETACSLSLGPLARFYATHSDEVRPLGGC